MTDTDTQLDNVEQLRAWVEENGLSGNAASKALGYRDSATVSQFLRGKRKTPDSAIERMNRVRAGLSPVADEPPVAEPPPRSDDDADGSLFDVSGTGTSRRVTTQSMGRFQRLEASMFVFFAGKDVRYTYPGADGKTVEDHFHQAGLADLLPPKDGAVVRDKAAEMAHAWAEWARTNPRVESFLSFFVMEGGLKGVIAATAPVVLTILANHGKDPLAFFLQPLSLNGAGDESLQQSDAWAPEYDPAANGDGADSQP